MRVIASRWNARVAFGIGIAVVIVFLGVTALSADPIVWSWEQELEPLDVLAFVEDLPYDEWIEIDEVTVRRLFEDIIQHAISNMELEVGAGGEFEELLRQDLLYFTPEFEYYWSWPTYAEDETERIVRFPVWIKRTKTTVYENGDADAISFSLGCWQQ
jgi:hypothetical protein